MGGEMVGRENGLPSIPNATLTGMREFINGTGSERSLVIDDSADTSRGFDETGDDTKDGNNERSWTSTQVREHDISFTESLAFFFLADMPYIADVWWSRSKDLRRRSRIIPGLPRFLKGHAPFPKSHRLLLNFLHLWVGPLHFFWSRASSFSGPTQDTCKHSWHPSTAYDA